MRRVSNCMPLLALLTVSSALAAPSALHAGYLLPDPRSADPGCAAYAQLDVPNEHNITPPQGGVAAQVDQERWTLTLRATRGPVTLDVPVTLVWGGLLDSPLNAAHVHLGLPELVHTPGQVVAFAQRGESLNVQRGPALGVGDISAALHFPAGPGTLAVQVAAPTGIRGQYVSVGALRVGAALSGPLGPLDAQVQLSVPLNGPQTTLAFLGPRPSVTARLGGQQDRWAWQAEVRSSPLAQAGWYGTWSASVRVTALGVTFAEDVRSPGADVALSAGRCLRRAW